MRVNVQAPEAMKGPSDIKKRLRQDQMLSVLLDGPESTADKVDQATWNNALVVSVVKKLCIVVSYLLKRSIREDAENTSRRRSQSVGRNKVADLPN